MAQTITTVEKPFESSEVGCVSIKVRDDVKRGVLCAYYLAIQLHDNGLGQRRIAKLLKLGLDRDIPEATVAGWIYSNSRPFAQEETQFKPKPKPGTVSFLREYVEQKRSTRELAVRYHVADATVKRWLTEYGLTVRKHCEAMRMPRVRAILRQKRLITPKTGFERMSTEKAYVLGVLCGDGYAWGSRVSLEIRKDEEFIREFVRCLEAVYGPQPAHSYYKPKRTFKFEANKELMGKDLMRYGPFFTREWEVPRGVARKREWYVAFLRGFFDSEGSVGKYSISALSANHMGLRQVGGLLGKLGIKTRLYRTREYLTLYVIHRKNLLMYYQMVGFTILRKIEKLRGVVKA